ncbi:MAG: M48 family metallopeptidase [Armatimonadetes bacterium]|nr:M48 family metallopeptidase [Armatimonadota bacterium]
MRKADAIATARPERIELGGRQVEYRRVRSRSARKLRLRVGPAGVVVVQPATSDAAEVPSFLVHHSEWILAQLARVEALKRVRRPQVVGQGEILFRGERLTVRVEESTSLRGAARVTLSKGGIVVLRGRLSSTPPERSLENWLRKQARQDIEAELEGVAGKLNRRPNRVYVMGQRTKWGNCSPLGNLSFNWRLILAPPYVLRYLVTHEAVHLAVPDHSKRFWLTVQSLCPEAERARQWLCANGERLMGMGGAALG